MKQLKSSFVLLILFVLFQVSFGQERDFPENWFRDIKGYDDFNTRYDYKFYTKEDVENAKKKFGLIENQPSKNVWEGIYTSNTELGTSQLYWSSADGFVYYYYYHTLRDLDFGKAVDKVDSVNLISEKSSAIKRKSIFSDNLIKIKFGDRHFLVPENRLQDFVKRAVGLEISLSDFGYYLFKTDELENKVFGLPILPKEYRHLQCFPISTKIISIENRQLQQDKFDDGAINYEEIYLFVKLGAGKDKKIEEGMNFFVEDAGEWIEITKVLPKTSIGKFRRSLDEERKEKCFNLEKGQGFIIPCKIIKVGMTAKTKVSETYF